MPRNGSGSFALVAGNPVIEGTAIDPAVHNTTLNDIAAEITNSLARDGQAAMTGPLDMGSEKIKNLETGTLRSDAVNLGQVQDGSFQYVATVGGTANAITLTPSPSISAYVAGQGFSFKVGSANTGATTVAVSGLAAKNLTKRGTTALVSGDLPANALVYIQYDGTQFQVDRVADVVTLTGSQTLTSKTLTSPVISGSPTISGATVSTSTLTSPVINTSVTGTAFPTQSEMESGPDGISNKIMSPSMMRFHPGFPKAWGVFVGGSAVAQYGCTLSKGGTGIYTFSFATAFSSTSYLALPYGDPTIGTTNTDARHIQIHSLGTTSCELRTSLSGALEDWGYVACVFFGDN